MEHIHIISETEIRDGRLNIRKNSLEPAFCKWFEQHTGKIVAITQIVHISCVVRLLVQLMEVVGDSAMVRQN